MTRFFIMIFVLVFLSASSFANSDCEGKLSFYGNRSSTIYSLNMDDVDVIDYGRDYLATAIGLIRTLIKKRGCSPSDINFGIVPNGRAASRCKFVSPSRIGSLSCYVETNVGYFNLTWDNGVMVNIIYNRWD